jgi:hypothetical protein
MKLSIIAGAGLLALSVITTPAAAVTGTGLQSDTPAARESTVLEKVHYWHRSCRLSRWGWHRHSYRWGRVPCRPWRFYRPYRPYYPY